MELQIKKLNEINIEDAKKLYLEAFNDSKEFIDLYFEKYNKNNHYYFWVDKNNKPLMMSCLNLKRVYINKEKMTAGFIVAVAVDKEYRGKGIFKKYFQSWLDEISLYYKYIFIQAYNWDVYSKYDFYPCTNKKLYSLRKDQYLKTEEYYKDNEINLDIVNDIYNNFVKYNRINNFSYKTRKENNLYYKMLLATNDKIYHTKKSYIFVSNNKVVDYAFLDLKDFIKLLSNFKDLIIESYIDLDKRYFTDLKETIVNTKVYKEKELNILFNELF